ncbi:hypothetical protein F511_04799 [Dorcoceras hygrometricum]|uniref:Dystroglycan-like n=1 Tax=Dorcoceras hygrometricum TaxID=472368 RepID=A0A2Z7AWM3_9LAMI|nr:hypothetical protein F511_04799 [Dorcoceras hygrometricum]
MASFIANALQIDFKSVLGISDNEGMVNMFKSLESTGVRGFLGCAAVFYASELEQFFDNAHVRNGEILSAVQGKFIFISEDRFAGVFGLPTEGLTDLTKVPKDKMYDARNFFSESGEPVIISKKKRQMKYEFRLLNDILAKSVFVKAGSFDAVTAKRFRLMTTIHFGIKINWSNLLFDVLKEMVDRNSRRAKGYAAQICMLLKGDPALTLGDATTFPVKKILTDKSVRTYVATNITIDARDDDEDPTLADIAIVKKKTASKKKAGSSKDAEDEPMEIVGDKVVEIQESKKRPVTSDIPVVAKKKRTTRGKTASFEKTLKTVPVAQEAIPLQIVEPRSSERTISDERIDERKPCVDKAVEQECETSAFIDVDQIIDQVVLETEQLETEEEFVESVLTESNVAEETVKSNVEHKNDDKSDAHARRLEETFENEPVEKAEGAKDTVIEKVSEEAVTNKSISEESMPIDDMLLQISEDMMLPSLTVHEITKIVSGLSVNIKQVDEVKGNTAREMVQLICEDVDFLVHMREQVMLDVIEFFHSFSLNNLPDAKTLQDLKEKERVMMDWAEAHTLEMAVRRRAYVLARYREMLQRIFLDFHRRYLSPDQLWTAKVSEIIDLLSVAHDKSIEELQAQQQEHGLALVQPGSPLTVIDSIDRRGVVFAHFYSIANSICWVRPVLLIDGVWMPIQGSDYWRNSSRLSMFVDRRRLPADIVEQHFESHNFLIEPSQYWGAAPSLYNIWKWASVCTEMIRYTMFGCLRPTCSEMVVYNLGVERLPEYFLHDFEKGAHTDYFVEFLSHTRVQPVVETDSISSSGDTVYRSPSPIVEDDASSERNLQFALGPSIDVQEEQLYYVQIPDSPPPVQQKEISSSSSDSFMDFHEDSPIMEETSAPRFDASNAQTSTATPLTADFEESLNQLRASISRLSVNLIKSLKKPEDFQAEFLSRIDNLERIFKDSLFRQEVIYQNQFHFVREEAKNLKAALSLEMLQINNEDKARDRARQVELAEIRFQTKDMPALKAEFADFQKKTESGIALVSAQLSEILDYINRVGADKKGEEASSSRPPPTSDVQGGDNIRMTTIVDRFDDDFYRRERERRIAGRSTRGRRRSSGGSSSRSGSGRSREYWLGGEE